MKATPTQFVLRAVQNQTKLNIIMLLADNEEMTVTQMSKFAKVTRANLYRAVSEMVREGLLLKPEARVKGNYVEKYYRLNDPMFEGVDISEQRRSLGSLATEDAVTMVRSIFEALSVQYRILAEQVNGAGAEERGKIANSFKGSHAIFSYTRLTDEEYEHFVGELRKVHESMLERTSKIKKRGGNSVIVTAFPQFRATKSSSG